MTRQLILPAVIDESNLIEFDLMTNHDQTATREKIILKDLEASEQLLNFVLRRLPWRGYYYNDSDMQKIGYGSNKGVDGIGMPEAEAYSAWLADFKSTERKFKANMPVKELTQTQYDAMLSLFYHTGTLSYIGTEKRRFDIRDWLKAGKWDYIATAMIESGHQRLLRQGEASILMLANYGRYKDRVYIKEDGLQTMRKMYPTLDDLQQKQAEYVYYVETKRFLPNMPDVRKRQVVKLYDKNY